ncbi:MAG: cytochrome c3 family protein [Desulfovibrionaceae bacterium]|nr:cytochrome c3 family protein [Desulfovibrionaceae bacterium]
MKRFFAAAMCAALGLAFCATAMAAGPHDMECMECHSTHYAKGDYAIGVSPNDKAINPARTAIKKTAADIDALCLGCHNDEAGIMPVALQSSHPTGVRPTYTNVPKQLLKDNMFSCVSCHNPHPSNPNYKYLIVATDGGKTMGVFCAKCHPAQCDPSSIKVADTERIKSDTASPPIVRIKPVEEEKKP